MYSFESKHHVYTSVAISRSHVEASPNSLPFVFVIVIVSLEASPLWRLCPFVVFALLEALPFAATMSRGKIGPNALPRDGTGTITSSQRKQILDETGCSAAVRQREAWAQRMCTVCGPLAGLQEADDMARLCIVGSQGHRLYYQSAD